MILKQFFDPTSSTLTYLIAAQQGAPALLIDPVEDQIDSYLEFLGKHELRLEKVFDTHTHADHISAMAKLRDITKCTTVMGEQSLAKRVSIRVKDNDQLTVGSLKFHVLYTPGHTDDSYCLWGHGMVFTGDTLLIRGTGRTDFQNGDAKAHYLSLFNRLLSLPDQTVIYPGHDYKGENLSTIQRERESNPRLQVKSQADYVTIMEQLNLPRPELMDIAVPANMAIGDDTLTESNRSLSADQAAARFQAGDSVFVDLRESGEIERLGSIPDALHLPFPTLADELSAPNEFIQKLLADTNNIILFCAHGERSALAQQIFKEAGYEMPWHIQSGYSNWVANNHPTSLDKPN